MSIENVAVILVLLQFGFALLFLLYRFLILRPQMRISELKDDNTRLQGENEALRAENSELRAKIDSLQIENRNLRNQVSNLHG